MGQALLQTCQVVPDGVLVFMPSYSLLDRLMQRWQVRLLSPNLKPHMHDIAV